MKKLLILVLAVSLLSVALNAASGAEMNVNAADFIGTWYVNDTAAGYDRTVIGEDGTVEIYPLDISIDAIEGTWTADKNGLTADLGARGAITITLEDDTLTLNDGTNIVEFTKQAPLAPVAEEFVGTWYGRKPAESAYAVTFSDDFTLKFYTTSEMSEADAVSGTWSLGTRGAVIQIDGGPMKIASEMDGCLTISSTDGSDYWEFDSGLDISK